MKIKTKQKTLAYFFEERSKVDFTLCSILFGLWVFLLILYVIFYDIFGLAFLGGGDNDLSAYSIISLGWILTLVVSQYIYPTTINTKRIFISSIIMLVSLHFLMLFGLPGDGSDFLEIAKTILIFFILTFLDAAIRSVFVKREKKKLQKTDGGEGVNFFKKLKSYDAIFMISIFSLVLISFYLFITNLNYLFSIDFTDIIDRFKA